MDKPRTLLSRFSDPTTRFFAAAGIVCLALATSGDAGRWALRFDRAAIRTGEVWRLLTGHFVHLDFRHTAVNIAGVALIAALFSRLYGVQRWVFISVTSIAAVDAGLWFANPEIEWYVGASGWLHGLMAAGAIGQWRDRRIEALILGAFLFLKLAWEQWSGALPFSGVQDDVVVDAHLYGALGGALAALLVALRRDSL